MHLHYEPCAKCLQPLLDSSNMQPTLESPSMCEKPALTVFEALFAFLAALSSQCQTREAELVTWPLWVWSKGEFEAQ